MRPNSTLFRSAVVAVIAGSIGLTSAAKADPSREGSGQRRDEIDAMELQPMPVAAWGGLTDWAGDTEVDATSAKGKVVLFYTWASWYPRSARQMTMVDRLAQEYADKGLIVVGVHDARGWDAGKEAAEKKSLSFPIAHDSDGEFRSTLRVDQDPDFYLVDRAGNLRFADITTSSVSAAVEQLVNETEEAAGTILQDMETRAAAAQLAATKTTTIRQDIDLASLSKELDRLAIPEPSVEEFENARWPRRIVTWERGTLGLGSRGTDGKPAERQLLVPQGAKWLNDRRLPLTKARVVVVYVWNPSEYKSYYRVQEKLEQLQLKYQRELVVVGVVTKLNKSNQSGGFGRSDAAQEEREKAELMALWDKIGRTTNFTHYNVLDTERLVMGMLFGERNNSQGDPAPLAMIFSSDKTMRWVGTPDHELFDSAIDRILAVDPWVKVRRAKEAAWLRSQKSSDG